MMTDGGVEELTTHDLVFVDYEGIPRGRKNLYIGRNSAMNGWSTVTTFMPNVSKNNTFYVCRMPLLGVNVFVCSHTPEHAWLFRWLDKEGKNTKRGRVDPAEMPRMVSELNEFLYRLVLKHAPQFVSYQCLEEAFEIIHRSAYRRGYEDMQRNFRQCLNEAPDDIPSVNTERYL